MNDICDWSKLNNEDDRGIGECVNVLYTKIGTQDDTGGIGERMESPVPSSQSCLSLLPNCSQSSSPSAPSRASFTESSIHEAPQMKTCTSTTQYFQLLFSLTEYTSEVARLQFNTSIKSGSSTIKTISIVGFI